MRQVLGVLTVIAGALLGAYLAFYVCLFGGLVQIGTALKQASPDVVSIAGGIVRVIMTGLVGWGTFVLCFLLGGYLFSTVGSPRRRSALRNPWDRSW